MEAEKIARLAYLDELVALQDGYEKLAAKKKEKPVFGAAAVPAGAALGAAIPMALRGKGIGARGRQAQIIKAQKVEAKGLKKELKRLHKMKKHPEEAIREKALGEIPKIQRQFGKSKKMLKWVKRFPTPRITPLRGAALGAGAMAAGLGIERHVRSK